VAAEAAAICPSLNVPIIIADSADYLSLDAMAKQAVCVITTAGRCMSLKPIKPNFNTVFLTYLHTTYVSFMVYLIL
jgi:hypothetical protein